LKGYTDVFMLADYMGVEFTFAQAQIALLAIGAAENWIDLNTRHAWLEPAQITEVIYPTRRPWVRVAKPPILSIDEVATAWYPGQTDLWVVDATCGLYVVRSLRDGLIWMPLSMDVYSLRVKYTPTAGAPPDEVKLATNVLAAATLRMSPAFMDDVDPTLVQRYSVGGELEVEFRRDIATNVVAAQQALSYLGNWTKEYSVV
jgi:hypothetical protein